jgi:hypothetical protein
MFGCIPASPHPQEIRKIALKHSHIIATSPPTPPLAAKIWFAAATEADGGSPAKTPIRTLHLTLRILGILDIFLTFYFLYNKLLIV